MSKFVSVDNWTKIIAYITKKDPVIITVTTECGSIDVEVKSYIPYEEMFSLAEDVVQLCILDDVFHWEVFDTAVDYFLLRYYTNIDCDAPLDNVYALMKYTDVIAQIKGVIGNDKYAELKTMAMACCESATASAKSEVEIFAKRINKLFDELETQVNAADTEKLTKSAEHIKGLVNEIEGASLHVVEPSDNK